ncbi:MAG: hypothetical protein GDA56_28740 [Hormoscilla sp. GM7CHS1pb]|nr:hypothetical protein [Hormoscilla sp. GM7CHS1pb]
MGATWLTDEKIAWVRTRSKKLAQQLEELREKPDNHRPYAQRKYWGAFICQGNPDPMEL